MFHGTSSFKEQTSASALRRLLQVSLLTIPDFSAKKTPPDTVLSAAHLLEVMKLGLPGLTLKESVFTVMFSCFCSHSVLSLSSLEMLYRSDGMKPETSGKKAGFSSATPVNCCNASNTRAGGSSPALSFGAAAG